MTPPPESAPPATVAPVAWAVVDKSDALIQLCHAEASAKRAVYECEARYTNAPFRVLPLYAADVPALMARIERAEAALALWLRWSDECPPRMCDDGSGYYSAADDGQAYCERQARAALGREGA